MDTILPSHPTERRADMTGLLTPRSDQRPRGIGVSSTFGTFGELVQGRDEQGVDFLVTLPISRWSTATFVADPDLRDIRVQPTHKHKALRVACAVVAGCGYPGGGRLVLESTIPEGKGLASSSADLVATARAVGGALGVAMVPARIEECLRGIEPSDGVMYDAVAVFNHRQVRLRRLLGSLPPMTVVGLDEGGVVDTVAFNRDKEPYPVDAPREQAALLVELERAVRAGDLRAVGRAATRSAELNQSLLPKRHLPALCEAAARLGALGVVIAHSGTVAGLLIADHDPDYLPKREAARRTCLALAGNAEVYHTLCFR